MVCSLIILTIEIPQMPSMQFSSSWGTALWVCEQPHQTGRHCNTPSPQWQHPQVRGPLVQYERAAYLSEGHLYLGITIKIKLGDGFTIFQNLYWCQFFGLSLSRRKKLRKGEKEKKEAKENRKDRRQGNEETKHKLDKWCSGHVWAFPEKETEPGVPRCRCGEDPHSGRGCSPFRTSSDRFVYKCKRCLPLQRKLPVDRGSQHFRRCRMSARLRVYVLAKEDSEWGQLHQYLWHPDILIILSI